MILRSFYYFLLLNSIMSFMACSGSDEEVIPPSEAKIQLITAQVGTISILTANSLVAAGNDIVLGFNVPINPDKRQEVILRDESNILILVDYDSRDNNKILILSPQRELMEGENLKLIISDQLTGLAGETFSGAELVFAIEKEALKILSLTADGKELKSDQRNLNLSLNPIFELQLSHDVPLIILEEELILVGKNNYLLTIEKTGPSQYSISPNEILEDLSKINFLFPSTIGTAFDRPFTTVSFELFTELDTTPKFPILPDEDLLDLVQAKTFKYFWDFGHSVSGLARERNTSGNLVTTGGSGFGLMAMIVGVERGFINRSQALDRWETIFDFLENAERFHGAWPHWMDGTTGKVIPFGNDDNGGDLVETAFLVQGMIAIRQYLDSNIPREADLINQVDTLWQGVEWDWYTQNGQEVLYWHWSADKEWIKNLAIRGHNETQIVYALAAASPTHTIDATVYDQGYARSGAMQNGATFYGYELPLGSDFGGPLFFTHYSYLGMNPQNLKDQYADYWQQNVNHTLINRAYCIDNPQNYVGYSENCWGLTASDNHEGYSAHSPTNDKGVITPTAAISSIPYTPEESMAALKHFYYQLGDRLWGEFGFYDAFNPTEGWVADSYLAIDQGPIIIMIENYRTGLIWDLYMSAPEVQNGLDKLNFTY